MTHITFDEFYRKYKIKRNPIELVSPYENTMLDFGDSELDYIETQPTTQVWSLTNEERSFVLQPGIHYKHIIGYFVTGRPWTSNNEQYELI